jgi:hypothetical protein
MIASKDGRDPIVELQISHSCNSKTKQHAKGEMDVQTTDFSQKHDKMTFLYHISNIMPHEENKM